MVSLDFLEKVEAFKMLDDEQLKAIQDCSHVEEFQKGARLFAQGQSSTHLWIVKEGQVDLRYEEPGSLQQNTGNISFASDAQTFGWSCFAPPYTYRLSGYCASRSCKVVKIEKERLIEQFEKDARFGYRVMSHLIRVVGTQFQQYQDEIARRRGEDIIHQW